MILVGLSGKIGTGKTVAANRLVGLGYRRRAYGDALKEEVAAACGIPLEQCYTAEGKALVLEVPFALREFLPSPATLREVLQCWGTEHRRKQDPDYWVQALRSWLGRQEPGGRVVVDDVRFPNEAELIHEFEGLLVRLEPFEGWLAGLHGAHVSETALDDYLRWHRVIRPRYGQIDRVAEQIAELARLKALCAR